MSWRERWSLRRGSPGRGSAGRGRRSPWGRGSRGGGAGLPCVDVVELVTDYLEDALPPDRRADFEEHVAGCDGCRAYLEQMRATIRAAGTLREEAMPPEVRERFREAFRDWTASSR
jgi:Putative zinc-finger